MRAPNRRSASNPETQIHPIPVKAAKEFLLMNVPVTWPWYDVFDSHSTVSEPLNWTISP